MNAETTQVQVPFFIAHLVDQQPSHYQRDEALDIDTPATIQCASLQKLKTRCRVKVVDANGNWTGSYKWIRHIYGSEIIDEEVQKEKGLVPNPAQDTIWVVGGVVMCHRQGMDIGKYEFLKNYDGNVTNPLRPDGSIDVIQELKIAEDAENGVDTMLHQFEAQQYLQSLVSKGADGKLQYEEDRIEFLSSLFKLPAFETGFSSEAWLALNDKMQEDPKFFMNTIAGHRAVYEADINQALTHGIIQIDANCANLTDTGKVLLKYTDKNLSEISRVNKLVDHLSQPANIKEYEVVRLQLKTKKTEAAGIIQ